ncbi:hypothetical protein MSAN_01736600 [Mycena sanguinolenta]|uniref:RRM domain-containing protein n=1 Tax=Mycena sanguinolenta TaxID=230812 RepID=A0A8H7CT69_9AGAR|nr:hypothetical protein MSAN_01736600 [Mycena sanguinolenta]
MSLSPHSSPSSPAPGQNTTTDSSTQPQISLPSCAPPTPPPDADDPSSRSPTTESQSTLTLASPLLPSLPTSVSSPAWRRRLHHPNLLLPNCLPLVHQLAPSALFEGGEIVQAQVLMKDLTLRLDLPREDTTMNTVSETDVSISASKQKPESQLEPGQIDEFPSSPPPSPPRAPSVETIPLPPIDAPSAYPPPVPPPSVVPVAAAPSAASSADAPPVAHDPSPAPAPAPAREPVQPEKTPNVYINGLPPNFPEDQLFELAKPFGVVLSVRSFTRHVGDTETGYGFVLFDTVAAAERCINTLRRYRNLHPTFSKQVHKIPGTMYSQASLSTAHAFDSPSHSSSNDEGFVHQNANQDNTSSLAGWEQESAGAGSADSGFKAKMARLADAASTNLYIEGLPLSIDEATLAALVTPYHIRSSRFFQTKLSSPPRIIAFVRLETRAAAEEIIERLHGRMVRGWNDPGSRISVRFADTSEQRELRRAERLAREGDQTSSQLSIAQATLLNLRGKDLHSQPHAHAPTHAHHSQRSDGANDFEVDYSRVQPAFNFGGQPQHPNQRMNMNPNMNTNMNMNPAMASLLESLQASTRRERDGMYRGVDYDYLEQQQHPAHPHPYTRGLGLGGATATEEFILRARSNSLPQQQQLQNVNLGFNGKRRPVPLDLSARQRPMVEIDDSAAANIGMGVRGYRAHAATLAFPHHQQYGALDPVNMDEEEFHAAASVQRRQQAPFDLHGAQQLGAHAHSLQHTNNTRMPRSQPSSLRGPSGTHDFIRTHPNNVNLSNNQQTHHYQNARNMNSHLNLRPAHDNNGANNNMHTNTNNSNPNHGIYERNNARDMRGMNRHNGTSAGYNSGSHSHSHSHSHVHLSQHQYDGDQPSPPLVSPALTYSSRSSTAAFSPTTPFFGSFDENETTLRADGVGKPKKNSRTATR